METLLHFKQFIDELNQNNSRNYKLEILKKYSQDDVKKYYLDFIFNPFITTGISSKKINKFHKEDVILHKGIDCSAQDLLELIKIHNTGDDSTLMTITNWKLNIEDKPELCDLLDSIITKNIQLGVDVKSINKIIPNLIPEFNVQLANRYFEKPECMNDKTFAITEKIDGGRIVALKQNGEVKFYTRKGQLYEGLVDLENEMKDFMPDNLMLDGEITLLDKGNLESKDQYKATMRITKTDGAEKHGVKMLVFDAMPATDFIANKCDILYYNRRAKLDEIFNTHNYKYFNLLPILYEGTDTSKILELLNKLTANGSEGVMLNDINATYQFRRCDSLVKVKKMADTDLIITGFEPGTNSNENVLGAIHCDYKGFDLRVGSGFTKEDREYIWNHQDEYLGKLAVIQYFEETTNDKGGLSLRFPVYKYIREIA